MQGMRRSSRVVAEMQVMVTLVAVLVLVAVVVAQNREEAAVTQAGPGPTTIVAPTAQPPRTALTTLPPSTATTMRPTTTLPPTTQPPPPPTTQPPPKRRYDPPRYPTTIATAVVSHVAVFDAPNGRVHDTLASPVAISKQALVFNVIPGSVPGWLHVALRTRPNGSTGWIRQRDVALTTWTWSVDINLTARWATVLQADQVIIETSVAIGTPASPTPVGDYFATEGMWGPNPSGPYGPFTFGLSAHSDVYTEYAGGDGQIGLHGTNQPHLLGSAVSAGCVRFPNDLIVKMAHLLPNGTPVHIHL